MASGSNDQRLPGGAFWDRVNEAIAKQNPEEIRESCIFNTVTHGAIGFLFGGALGMFMSGMATSSPELSMMGTPVEGKSIPASTQVKMVLQDMGKKTWGSAKSFGKIAAIYSASECVIEGVRRFV
jgi:import inner membrane translocase subunit TIM22